MFFHITQLEYSKDASSVYPNIFIPYFQLSNKSRSQSKLLLGSQMCFLTKFENTFRRRYLPLVKIQKQRINSLLIQVIQLLSISKYIQFPMCICVFLFGQLFNFLKNIFSRASSCLPQYARALLVGTPPQVENCCVIF